VNIIAALDHPELFGPHFRGDTWRAWRVFLTALFALPMDENERAIYQRHTGRTRAPTVPFKEAALVVGRRGGKSRILALVATYLAVFFDYAPNLAPGELATIGVIAADRKQARTIFRFIIGLLREVRPLAAMIEDDASETITLTNRVTIEIHTASFRVTRGYTFAAVLADETAFWRDENSANPDSEIFRALRPGLSSIPGAILLNASSPYRKAGILYSTYRRHFGKDHARVLVWRGTTAEMNPSLDPAIIAEAYADDAASAAAEYGAEFRDDIVDFVSREVVDACTVPGRFELPRISGLRYHAFVDPSGGSADAMTLAIAHREKDGRALLDVVREVRPPFSPNAVVTDFVNVVKGYGIARVRGDRYAGEWAREPFRKLGIEYELSPQPRSDLYRDLLPKLNSRQVELLDIPRLSRQLCDLERRTARGGRDSIDHPPGGHDDVANSVAGAVLMASAMRQPMRIDDETLRQLSIPPHPSERWLGH
jgi:hypothetical protein